MTHSNGHQNHSTFPPCCLAVVIWTSLFAKAVTRSQPAFRPVRVVRTYVLEGSPAA